MPTPISNEAGGKRMRHMTLDQQCPEDQHGIHYDDDDERPVTQEEIEDLENDGGIIT
jgi:hypothetical protein